MRILFTPAGDTDPVRGYHDGAILHILRHYDVDRVILFLTADMEKKEEDMACYTKGIHSVSPQTSISCIKSGITEPQRYESLTVMQADFAKAYEENPGAEWLLNVSSGTPQIKTVMALLALDYPKAKAIQVHSPEKSSNHGNHPCRTSEELVEMLDCNEDNEEGAPNRCDEPPLLLLKRHGISMQIESLVRNYEYAGAYELVRLNPTLFSGDTKKLLQHAMYRRDLLWRQANKVISQYKGKPLIASPDDFSEYFQVMELRERKRQYPEFVVKLSPVLVELGIKYMEKLTCFHMDDCCEKRRNKKYYVKRYLLNRQYPKLLAYLETQLRNTFRDGPLYFNTIVHICEYLQNNDLKGNSRHERITHIFTCLRVVEERTRNLVAHEITNLDDDSIQKATAESWDKSPGIPGGLRAKDIITLLHEAARLITGKDIPWTYDSLNDKIIESLRQRE